jgi:hypothetical protein
MGLQVTIGDLTGSAQIDISSDSLAGKSELSQLKTAAAGFIAALSKPVTDPTFEDATFGATFENPTIPLGNNVLDIAAGVNSTLSVSRSADSPLFGPDDYDPININGNECWVSFELNAQLSANVAVPLPDGFGVSFGASASPDFTTFLLIADAQAPSTTLSQAIGQTLNAFRVLESVDDLLSMPQNVIYTSDLSGSVNVAGSWALPLAVNQLSLADANLPFNAGVTVAPSLTVAASGSIEITSEFALRFRRPTPQTLHVGLYKKKGTTLQASFTAAAGLGAFEGQSELINAFFQAVAPGIDASILQSDDSGDIEQALSGSIDRSLAISLNAACSAAVSDEAAFAYAIDISDVNQATKDALASTLLGDWSALTKLPNARKLRNIITETLETGFSLNVNLLGIYNFSSVGDFIKSMKVLKNDVDGSVTITDTATASRISVASTPLAAVDDRLRSALNEGFVATAAYQALLTGTGAKPTLAATQNFLDYHETLDYRKALKELNAGEVLGVMPLNVKTGMAAIGKPVSHARFAASRTYTNDDVLRFFFSDIQNFTPRNPASLIQTGRQVLAGLLDPQDPTDQKRISALQSDSAWVQMTANPAQIQPTFYSDWYDITNWASAIAKAAPLLADAIRFAKTVPGDPTANPTFMKKRAALASALNGVTHNTNAAFEKAFPLCVMSALHAAAAAVRLAS